MGYEKFVKKVFPFIGKQYPFADDENFDGYKKIDLIVGEIVVDDSICYLDFDQGKAVVVPDGEIEKALNHLIIFAKEGEETIESVGLAYLVIDGQAVYFWYSSQNQLDGNELPWECGVYNSDMSFIKNDHITADMIGVKEAIVSFNPDFDAQHPEKWMEDLDFRIATIYYKK